MSKFYHFNPPKREDYRTEEEYEEALEEWREWASIVAKKIMEVLS